MENEPVQRRPLPMGLHVILLILWLLIGWFMLLIAIIGVSCTLLGLTSLCVDLSGTLEMHFGGEAVRTTTQKVLFTAFSSAMALTGIGYWWLRLRGYVGGALLCYAVLLGLFLAIAWSGNGDIISVGEAAH